jgi:hypothetical protein
VPFSLDLQLPVTIREIVVTETIWGKCQRFLYNSSCSLQGPGEDGARRRAALRPSGPDEGVRGQDAQGIRPDAAGVLTQRLGREDRMPNAGVRQRGRCHSGGGRRRSTTRRCGVPRTTCCSPPRKEFVPFAEMGGGQPESPVFWNPGTRLFEATVVRRNGPDLVIRNLPLLTANHFRKALIDALRERYT